MNFQKLTIDKAQILNAEKEESRLDSLEKNIDNVKYVVYQLLGQSSCEIDKDTTMWHTTRQGDQNESEIELLKQQVSKLEGTIDVLVQLLTHQHSSSNCEDKNVKPIKEPPQEATNYITRYGPAAKWNEDEDNSTKMWGYGYTEGACYASADFSDGEYEDY